MEIYNVRVSVIVRLQGAHSPQAAENQAWKRIEELVRVEPLACVTAAQATVDSSEARR